MKSALKRVIFSGLALGLVLAACSPAAPAQTTPNPAGQETPGKTNPTQPAGTEMKTPVEPGVQLISNQSRIEDPAVPPEDLSQLVDDNSAFAVALYQQLRGQSGNLFFSPYSISLALAMTMNGANGDTASQMASALHLSLPPESLNPAFDALDLALQGNPGSSGSDFQLEIANSIWPQHNFDFLPAFLDTLAKYYGSGIYPVDYTNPEAVRQQINNWVAQQTADKIQDLIPQGALDPLTRLVLANAIYFKAAWQYPFNKDQTAPADFTLLDGSKVQVPTMHLSDSLSYYQGKGYQAVAMPYSGGTVSMIVVMPDEGNFEAFEQNLSADAIRTIRNGLKSYQVDLSMPSFKIESSFDLGSTLKSMGMTDAFSPTQADFSNMDGRNDLYISSVVHKAYVNVDEQGTEAAAATGVVVGLTSILTDQVTLSLDHPFLVMIVDNTSGSLLFLGRVENPVGG